ncbi:unnamed protein product [Miscanthus lutarioriparius]|uniref:Uncharacterized protein n=1 Tax=Miscanthus lutarioriparius TaxID=422564 RepID=A0A811NUM4_9POAL|nr:unnamed protein product [Miscanthus lutarioriparius]
MPPKELPGFYYDPEKNRYFPIRAPIPGAAVRRCPPPAPAVPPLPADTTGCSRKRARRPELLSAREMHGGGVIFSNSAARSTFKQQWHYAQASQPMVWKYQATTSVADKALEQLDAMIQTPQGLKESRMVVTGSMNGLIGLYGLGTALNNFENEAEFLPEPAWTPAGKHKAGALPSIWSSEVGYTTFPSSSDIGAGLLDLETRGLSWLCRSKSDVLSLKFVHSGKVVLCGLRNGSIAPVDVRQKQHNQPTGVASSSNARRTVPILPTRHAGKKRNQAGMDKFSRVISMSSAVCSLVTLSSDENYFLGSSMDGSIKLFDLRLIQKGVLGDAL